MLQEPFEHVEGTLRTLGTTEACLDAGIVKPLTGLWMLAEDLRWASRGSRPKGRRRRRSGRSIRLAFGGMAKTIALSTEEDD